MNASTPRHAKEPEQIDFTIVTPNLDAEQVAAVTAVLHVALAGDDTEPDGPVTAAAVGWEKSRRDLRSPIHPAPGEWRRHR